MSKDKNTQTNLTPKQVKELAKKDIESKGLTLSNINTQPSENLTLTYKDAKNLYSKTVKDLTSMLNFYQNDRRFFSDTETISLKGYYDLLPADITEKYMDDAIHAVIHALDGYLNGMKAYCYNPSHTKMVLNALYLGLGLNHKDGYRVMDVVFKVTEYIVTFNKSLSNTARQPQT